MIHWRTFGLFGVCLLLIGCGGGSGGSGSGGDGGGDVEPPAVDIVTVSGTVSFDYVPIGTCTVLRCLDYSGTVPRAARGVSVQVIDIATTALLGATVTDEAGHYSISAPADTDALVRVRAEMRRGAPGWDLRVVDNTAGGALYVLEGTTINTGNGVVEDMHADSGWTGSEYGSVRAAAPFAILDVIYDAMQLVHDAEPSANFPPLVVHWSPDNVPNRASDGSRNTETGEIGSSFYRSDVGIFLLGAEDEDTEEYDRHVIAHEWGHYFQRVFSRSDSFGGPHATGDQLDMRIAFGEGLSNAIAAIVTGDPLYVDTVGPAQQFGFNLDIEGTSTSAPGWYSQASVQEILYDIYDPVGGDDALELGFGPILDVLVGPLRDSEALTSIFAFIDALKNANPAFAADIDTIVSGQDINPVQDGFGTGETNAGTPVSADVLPIYEEIFVNGPSVNVCSTDDFSSGQTGSVNKLGSRRYLRFTVSSTADALHTFTMTTTEAPAGESTDPDMWLHQAGPIWPFIGPPSPDCAADRLDNCIETGTAPFLLSAGDYVLDVYEWTNADSLPDEFSPIGRACFDVEVTSP